MQKRRTRLVPMLASKKYQTFEDPQTEDEVGLTPGIDLEGVLDPTGVTALTPKE